MLGNSAFALAFLLVFIAIWIVAYLRARADGASSSLREIPAYTLMQNTVIESAEDGRPMHLSLGTAGIADGNAMETLSALSALDFLSRQSALTLNLPLVTTGNPTTLLLAQDVMSKPFKDRDHLAQFDPLSARFIGGANDGGAAYAAGVIDLLNRREVAANFMLGRFGDEYLLAGETAARDEIPQVAGTGNPSALPFMLVSANQTLIGEELFAAGAYLLRQPWHLASLAAQDTARWLMIASVGAVVALKTLGML